MLEKFPMSPKDFFACSRSIITWYILMNWSSLSTCYTLPSYRHHLDQACTGCIVFIRGVNLCMDVAFEHLICMSLYGKKIQRSAVDVCPCADLLSWCRCKSTSQMIISILYTVPLWIARDQSQMDAHESKWGIIEIFWHPSSLYTLPSHYNSSVRMSTSNNHPFDTLMQANRSQIWRNTNQSIV
jgi:hypothetical protein